MTDPKRGRTHDSRGRFAKGNRASSAKGRGNGIADWRRPCSPEETKWRDTLRARLRKRGGLGYRHAREVAAGALTARRLIQYAETLHAEGRLDKWAALAKEILAAERVQRDAEKRADVPPEGQSLPQRKKAGGGDRRALDAVLAELPERACDDE